MQAEALISYLMEIFPPKKYRHLFKQGGIVYKIVREKYGLSETGYQGALDTAIRLYMERKKIPIDEQIPPELGKELLKEAGWINEEDNWNRQRR